MAGPEIPDQDLHDKINKVVQDSAQLEQAFDDKNGDVAAKMDETIEDTALAYKALLDKRAQDGKTQMNVDTVVNQATLEAKAVAAKAKEELSKQDANRAEIKKETNKGLKAAFSGFLNEVHASGFDKELDVKPINLSKDKLDKDLIEFHGVVQNRADLNAWLDEGSHRMLIRAIVFGEDPEIGDSDRVIRIKFDTLATLIAAGNDEAGLKDKIIKNLSIGNLFTDEEIARITRVKTGGSRAGDFQLTEDSKFLTDDLPTGEEGGAAYKKGLYMKSGDKFTYIPIFDGAEITFAKKGEQPLAKSVEDSEKDNFKQNIERQNAVGQSGPLSPAPVEGVTAAPAQGAESDIKSQDVIMNDRVVKVNAPKQVQVVVNNDPVFSSMSLSAPGMFPPTPARIEFGLDGSFNPASAPKNFGGGSYEISYGENDGFQTITVIESKNSIEKIAKESPSAQSPQVEGTPKPKQEQEVNSSLYEFKISGKEIKISAPKEVYAELGKYDKTSPYIILSVGGVHLDSISFNEDGTLISSTSRNLNGNNYKITCPVEDGVQLINITKNPKSDTGVLATATLEKTPPTKEDAMKEVSGLGQRIGMRVNLLNEEYDYEELIGKLPQVEGAFNNLSNEEKAIIQYENFQLVLTGFNRPWVFKMDGLYGGVGKGWIAVNQKHPTEEMTETLRNVASLYRDHYRKYSGTASRSS